MGIISTISRQNLLIFLQKKREKNVKCENYVVFTSDKCQNINLFEDPYQRKFLKFSLSLFVLTAMHFALVTLNNIWQPKLINFLVTTQSHLHIYLIHGYFVILRTTSTKYLIKIKEASYISTCWITLSFIIFALPCSSSFFNSLTL